jgi:hypothetical protein
VDERQCKQSDKATEPFLAPAALSSAVAIAQ